MKKLIKMVSLIAVIFGRATVFVYGCELLREHGQEGVIYPVAIPVDVLKTTGLAWFTLLYEKHGKATKEVIRGLLNLINSESRIEVWDGIPENELIAIKDKYNCSNYGYAFEYYFVEQGCKHADYTDDTTNKRDVYIKRYWTAGRKTARGCQLKCSIRQSSCNF